MIFLVPGDVVYVNAPVRNIADARTVVGEYPVVEYQPNHAQGPCVRIKDEHGETTVGEEWTLPLAMKKAGQKP
jgi:hypothetical protein